MADSNAKILELDSLSERLGEFRRAGKKISHCHGVFDLLHIGHIRHFKQAKEFGDLLVVTITADAFVNKGPHRPAFTAALRAEAIASLEYVDFVAVNDAPSAVPAIKAIKPAFYVKGKDYRDRPANPQGKLAVEEKTVIEEGGSLVFTDDIQFSSSTLLNRHFSPFSPAVNQYLEEFRQKHPLDEVLSSLERMKNLKVLVIGETIIDDYRYVEAIGKAGKEPVLVTRSHSGEQFAGGSLAIANHVAGFCDTVGLFSCLGTKNSYEAFVRERLKPNITPIFHHQKNRPTIVKLRYVDHYLLQKLFEVYDIDDEELSAEEEEILLKDLDAELPKYDLAIVADYGHGMLSHKAIDLLCSKAKFLCVNTQANAGNRGLHTISKYPRADYISFSEGELRLELRMRTGDVHDLVHQVQKRIDCPLLTVTRGKAGILCFKASEGFSEGPGFTQSFVDRIGSGDAVLSVTSPLAALGVHPDILAFVGNVAGSEAVKTVGHRSSLDFEFLKRLITSLLK